MMYDSDNDSNNYNYGYTDFEDNFIFDQQDMKTYTNQPSQTDTVTYSAPSDNPPPNSTPPKKLGGGGNTFLAIALAAVLGGSSLGIGIGVGGGLYNKFTASSVVTEEALTKDIPKMNYESVAISSKDDDAVSVIKKVSNSVVSINLSTTVTNIFNRAISQPSAGSGVIFSEDSEYVYIVTNNHVISGATSAEISLDDSTSVKASYVGSDVQADIAIIKASKADLKEAGVTDYLIATFGDADVMEIGDTVIAIGNALGEGKSATQGIVSAKNKEVMVKADKTLTVIQTDAAINQGNSGGALINLKGQVIGINTVKISGTGVEGMGYAIPSNTVKDIVDTIMTNDAKGLGTAVKPYLGISGATINKEFIDTYGSPIDYGIYVVSVSNGSGAQEAGLRSGDIIVEFNGKQVTTMEEMQKEIAQLPVKQLVDIGIYRNGDVIKTKVEIKDSNAVAF